MKRRDLLQKPKHCVSTLSSLSLLSLSWRRFTQAATMKRSIQSSVILLPTILLLCVCVKNTSDKQRRRRRRKKRNFFFLVYSYIGARPSGGGDFTRAWWWWWLGRGFQNTWSNTQHRTLCDIPISSTNSLHPPHAHINIFSLKKNERRIKNKRKRRSKKKYLASKYPDHGRSGGPLLHIGEENLKKGNEKEKRKIQSIDSNVYTQMGMLHYIGL